ncbi:MAG: hypothetical protein FD130_482 [Halothiobacillaceae bacterium]|nr:MAG: hypothetical protein FD130_482 [Halothiobacillaceae bacterium]
MIRRFLVTVGCLTVISGCAAVNSIWPFKPASSDKPKINIEQFQQVAKSPDGDRPPAKVLPDKGSVAGEAAVVPELFKPLHSPEILEYWESITGGSADAPGFAGTLSRAITGGDYIRLVRPVAVCVRGDFVYIVDMGLQLVLRLNRSTGVVERMAELRGVVTGDVADIFVTKDMSFYVTDTFGGRVLFFSPEGRLQRSFTNGLNLVHPVAVMEDEATESVLVADGEFDHILVFNQMGDPYTTLGGRGEEPGKFLNITAMASDGRAFYVAARVGQRIQVLSRQSEYLYSFEQESIRFPLALAVDDRTRLFASDYLDNTIKIYERGRLINSFGGTGVTPGRFKRITDLWLDGDLLYVADSLNGRVQVMKVAGAVPRAVVPAASPSPAVAVPAPLPIKER